MTFDTVVNRRTVFNYQQKHHGMKKTMDFCRSEPRGRVITKGACEPLDQDLPFRLTTRHKLQKVHK